MENFIDDIEAYQRLKPSCECGCNTHCGYSCWTDGCHCEKCSCPACVQQNLPIGPTDI